MKVKMHQEKSQLPRLGRLAWEGEEVVIARAGEPYLRLEPDRERAEDRTPDRFEGQIWMSPNFDDPTPDLEEAIGNSKILPDDE